MSSSKHTTYTAAEAKANPMVRGRAMYDAGKGNESARAALRDAAAVLAAASANDPLQARAGQGVTDLPPTAA